MTRSRIMFAAIALLIAPATLDAQDPAVARVDAIFQRWASDTTPGCAVGVARDGRTLVSRAYGMADLENGVRNSPATIFEAGSVSKQFTAAAVLLLVADGKLSLDDDVRKYVPELPDYGTTIRIRHLLNHTSGLRDWGSVAGIGGWGRGERSHTHDHVVDILSRQRALNFTPGAQYSYSNSGFNLMAVIVDRVSGMSFAEFSRRRIFEPLGLAHTQWRDDYTRIVKGRSAAYGVRGSSFAIDRPIEDVHGNGGLLTTVGDLLLWNDALTQGRLGDRVTAMMTEQGVLNDGTRITYAAGLVVQTYNGTREISHTGSTAGYRAFLARYPDQKLSVAMLCNVGAVSTSGTGHQIADVFLTPVAVAQPAAANQTSARPNAAALPPVMPTPAQLATFAGEYYSPDAETTLTVKLENGVLVGYRRPRLRFQLTPTGADAFTSPLGRIRFIQNGDAITQLSVQQERVFDLRFDRVTPPTR